MRKYIIFGRFNKYHLIIFISIIFQIINEAIYGFNYNENIFDDMKIFHNKGHEYFSKHILIHLFFSQIGTFIFTIPFYIYEIKALKENYTDSLLLDNKKNKKNKKKQYLLTLLITLLWIVEEYLFIFYAMILGGLEFWFLELLIICFLTSKMFHLKIYKHQKLALILNIFPLFIKFIFIILSTKLEKKTSNKIFIKYIWLIPLGFLIYLILAFIRSFVNIKIQKLFNYYFASQNKILMIYGLMGAIITSIFCIFTSNFNCNAGEIQDYFCNVSEYNSSKKYMDSFPIYHNTFQGYSNDKTQIILEILVIIFGGITFFINKYSFLLLIKYFNSVFFVFSFPILFLLRKIILIINTLFISKSFFVKEVMRINKFKCFFEMIGDFLSIVSFLIYFEIIELNFCNYNNDIIRNIKNRGFDIIEPEPYPEDEDIEDSSPIVYV